MAFDYEAIADATSGAFGGLLSTTAFYPLDTCKTKYQAELQSGNSCKYRSLLDVLREAIATRQFLSLYQGLGTKNLQSIVSQFLYFYSYSYFKQLYLRRSKAKHMGTSANLLVAAAAGAFTVVLTQPLDTASAKMQTSEFGKSKGLWKTLTEGTWKETYDGLGASLILVSNPSIQYTVFEQLKRKLIDRKLKSKNDALLHSGDKDVAGSKIMSSPPVLSALAAFLLGAISKTVATIVTYPAIRCKVTIQAAEEQNTEQKSEKRPLRSMLQTIQAIWEREGAAGFYKGIQGQILKTVLSAAFMLMIKEKVSKVTWVIILALRQSLIGKPIPKVLMAQEKKR